MNKKIIGSIAIIANCLAVQAYAQVQDPGTSPAIAAKVALRGDAHGIQITEMRITRPNDILVVAADMLNSTSADRMVFYRFRWLDSVGNQVGDGESWKQMGILGHGQQTVKSVAPTNKATDFKLEMNVN
ncbi:MAG: YcfL family protein [Candidatus Methylumidiphilus sp.]|jgi:uncharacterized protein YcfL